MSKLNYKTSKNYKWLKKLLDAGEEVIVLKSGVSPSLARKIDNNCYSLGYLEEYSKGNFLTMCRVLAIEFIEPNVEE